MEGDDMVPVVAVRLAEGRCGSTLLMQLLATAPEVVFDDRYPAEYRYLSYFARMATMMTEPFDEAAHVGVTPFFFGLDQPSGPIPFRSEVLDVAELTGPLLTQMWTAWSKVARVNHPSMSFYAEKIAVDLAQIAQADIPLRVVDLVRDPRDVLASIKAFTSSGIDGFGRRSETNEDAYVHQFVATFDAGLARMELPTPLGTDRLLVRYEDLVADLSGEAARIGDWLGVKLDAGTVEANRSKYERHTTAPTPAQSIGRWRRDLTDDHARVVADRLRARAAHFGYQL